MANEKTKQANWAIARARWEGEPRCSYSDLVDFLGISKQGIAKRANKEEWQKKADFKSIAVKAHAAADRKQGRNAPRTPKGAPSVVEAQKPPAISLEPTAPIMPAKVQDSKNATPEMLAAAVEDAAVDARATLLKRHRDEWPAARNQLYKSLKAQDLDGARLAKLAAESLKIVQDGERKAWGLDAGGDEDKAVRVVIERTEGVRVVR